MDANDVGAACFARQEFIHPRDGTIKHRHAETVVVHIERQVLAHYRQPDQADVCCCVQCRLPKKLCVLKYKSSQLNLEPCWERIR